MSTGDPFDQVRKSNPVDPKDLPSAPLGTANRIMSERLPGRLRISGPALGLASMLFVLVVGALATTIMLGGSDDIATSQRSTVTTPPSLPATTGPEQGPTTATLASEEPQKNPGEAPWSTDPLPQSAVPQHLIEDWADAENQTWCSALYPSDPIELGGNGISRSAEFSGGWAIAWDFPDGPGRSENGSYCTNCGRSAYGIAGVGATGTINDLAIWPNQIHWDDDSRAGFGFEGLASPGSGAPLLAYLLVDGQGCLYNVWSFLGDAHLYALLGSLRFVEGMQVPPVELIDRVNQVTREMDEAPWNGVALAASSVPSVFFEEWNDDLGTTACPMMAFSELGPEGEGATPRRASGDSALIVAWDLLKGPGRYGSGDYCADCGRGAFGTSLWQQEEFFQQEWNPTLRFSDGSSVWVFPELSMDLPSDRIAHFDPETGAPAPEAYRAIVEVSDHPDCLYQVWSSYGPAHVEYLVSRLRYVEDRSPQSRHLGSGG